jgi:hypothetical protein
MRDASRALWAELQAYTGNQVMRPALVAYITFLGLVVEVSLRIQQIRSRGLVHCVMRDMATNVEDRPWGNIRSG